jgi:hypothetical protein
MADDMLRRTGNRHSGDVAPTSQWLLLWAWGVAAWLVMCCADSHLIPLGPTSEFGLLSTMAGKTLRLPGDRPSGDVAPTSQWLLVQGVAAWLVR